MEGLLRLGFNLEKLREMVHLRHRYVVICHRPAGPGVYSMPSVICICYMTMIDLSLKGQVDIQAQSRWCVEIYPEIEILPIFRLAERPL